MTRSIVFYTDTSIFGGLEQVLLVQMQSLDRSRWQPLLFHHGDPGLSPLIDQAQAAGIETRQIDRMRRAAGLAKLPEFARLLRDHRPAVFHAHMNWPLACHFGVLAAALARVPAVVATQHYFVPIPWRRSLALERLISLAVDRYIAVSHVLAKHLLQTFHFPPSKLEVIHNGIDVTAFDGPDALELRRELTDGLDRPVVLTLARLDQQKGHAFLLDAAPSVPEAVFVFAGEGPDRASLETRARASGLAGRVRFLGHRRDVARLLRACDVFVLPSLGFEGLPMSILEAMAAGRPVVATAVGGTPELVRHGETGLLVPPGDAAALGQALSRVLSDRDLACRLGEAARGRAAGDFSNQATMDRLERVYADVLARA